MLFLKQALDRGESSTVLKIVETEGKLTSSWSNKFGNLVTVLHRFQCQVSARIGLFFPLQAVQVVWDHTWKSSAQFCISMGVALCHVHTFSSLGFKFIRCQQARTSSLQAK